LCLRTAFPDAAPPSLHSTALRAVLLRTAAASAVPRLTGCSWRADHTVSSSHDRGSGASAPPPTFWLTLHTERTAAVAAGGEPGPQDGERIALSLSMEQMQHLSFSLKEALHAAEREAAAA
jgi:hypothetical protein